MGGLISAILLYKRFEIGFNDMYVLETLALLPLLKGLLCSRRFMNYGNCKLQHLARKVFDIHSFNCVGLLVYLPDQTVLEASLCILY